jgi:HAD superfamily hydrolase (TIGR01509 family)
MKLRALLLDVDGTLADTEERHRQAFNAAFGEACLGWSWGHDVYRDLLQVAGGRERIRRWMDLADPARARSPEADALIAALHRGKTAWYERSLAHDPLPLRTGVARLLDEAARAGIRLAIVTTTTPSNIDALLVPHFGHSWRERFAFVLGGDSVSRLKPEPDVYLLALSRLGLDARECLAFEDSANGIRAAHAAGLAVVATPTWYSLAEPLPPTLAVLPHLGDPGEPLPAGSFGAPWVDVATLAAWHSAARRGERRHTAAPLALPAQRRTNRPLEDAPCCTPTSRP